MKLTEVATMVQGLNTSGRGAGARPGDWRVKAVAAGDIQDDAVAWSALEEISIQENERTRRYLLEPHDVLLTARSTSVKAALVPADIANTVAVGSLMILRPRDPAFDVGHVIWLYLTSSRGREEVRGLMTGATILYLPPKELAEVLIPMPAERELELIADLVDVTEQAYERALIAAAERRSLARELVMDKLGRASGTRRNDGA